MKTTFLKFFLTLLMLGESFPKESNLLAQSFRIFPNDQTYQYEPIIVVSRINPMIMFCSSNTFFGGTFFNEGVYVTTNGGLNWFGSDTCKGQNINNHGGDPGIAIDKNGVFILKHIASSLLTPGVYTHYSTDMGITWSLQSTVSQGSPTEDKGSLTTDNNPISQFYGRSYITGVNYQPPYPVLFAFTTNNGVNWSSYSAIGGSAADRCSGGELAIGPSGQVYNIWAVDSGAPPGTEKYAKFGSSTDGGVTWIVNQNIFNMHGIGMLYTPWSILVNGIPKIAVDVTAGPRNGWIYGVTNEYNIAPAGSDFDVLFHRSTNGGQSWSPGIRVNQDPLNNGKIQLFPAVCVDSTGAIDVLYYDNRNTTSDSLQVYLSRSTDGGNTWVDYQISDKTFAPKTVPFTNSKMGDFIDIISTRNKLFPVWMADYTSSGRFQIWMRIIDMNSIGVQQISTRVPENFILKQNYPNPFNPSTTIEFSLPKKENIKITIYDALGKEISNVVNSELEPGTYKTEFDGTNYSSGIYFYKLQSKDFLVAKKMILIK
jgi:hypothetical protein